MKQKDLETLVYVLDDDISSLRRRVWIIFIYSAVVTIINIILAIGLIRSS